MPTKLSVNINKVATIRNSRGGNNPNVVQVAIDCQKFGADGITVHPRPDERHIRYDDVREISKIITTEFNIEGNPKEDKFVQLVLEVKPTQVTLVPDELNQLTSNHGWDIKNNRAFLIEMVQLFKKESIRVSLFIDPVSSIAIEASQTGTDRVELYTEDYARKYLIDADKAVYDYVLTAKAAAEAGLGVNAGHDLDMHNLAYFVQKVKEVEEVSIGHALIADALYYGLQNTSQMYQRCLKKN